MCLVRCKTTSGYEAMIITPEQAYAIVRNLREAMTKMSGVPVARFRNQPGIVLREREAWTVVDRNSRNARVFGARYWREG
jgi:hypothetical protein